MKTILAKVVKDRGDVMGLRYTVFTELIEKTLKYFSDTNIAMLELGNQIVRQGTYPKNYPIRKFRTAKDYFKSIGINHVSIDRNGKSRSMPLNLAKPIDKKEWKNYFDCVTDLGTIEHVCQNGLEGQYYSFKNVHDFCKVNGYMLHCLPLLQKIGRKPCCFSIGMNAVNFNHFHT